MIVCAHAKERGPPARDRRQAYGEPKKIAQIAFQRDARQVSAEVTRMGIAHLEGRGTLHEMEYEEGTTQSNGAVLRPIPAEWLLPVLHQRYDDPQNQGIEISGA